ncbi:MAG: hypothetical protein Q7R65_02700 [bacterium]|nr:hypothetical protein [bacterium]
MKTLIRELENEVLKNQKLTRESLSRELAQKFLCTNGVIKRILQGKCVFFPIPIILELTKRSRRKKTFLSRIKNDIEFLKINSASAKPIRAVRKLTRNLAKIIGAFMADGSLSVQIIFSAPTKGKLAKIQRKIVRLKIKSSFGYSKARKEHYISLQVNTKNIKTIQGLQNFSGLRIQTHYNIELTEEYKDNVEAFNKWIKEAFYIKPTNFQQRKNAWRTIFSNKIIARFLMQFFEVIPGPKTYTAYEPVRVQKASLGIRKSFARGVLMFDGCVTKSGRITLSSKSQKLASAIKEIWMKDNIAHGVMKKNKRDEWIVYTTSKNLNADLLDYFEPNTQKRKLLHWINGNNRIRPVIKKNLALSATKILLLLKKIKSCDISFLERHFKKRYTSIRHYLKILKNQKKIRISTRPSVWSHHINEKATVYLGEPTHNMFFAKIKEKLNLGKNAASILGVHKATFSAWKLKKNRIPVEILRQLCPLLNINFENLTKNITQTDRDIVELT